MSIAFGAQSVNPSPSTTATTHACSLTCVAGDLIVLLISSRDEVSASGVSGDVDGAFARAGDVTYDTSGGGKAEIWYFANSAGGAQTITATFGSSTRAGLNCSRWTGAATSSALDQENGNVNGNGTSHHHGSITTTGAGLVITSMAQGADGGAETQSGFTALTDNAATDGYNRSYYGYRIVTGSTTEDGDLTTGNSVLSAGKIASFNEAATASVVLVPVIRQNYRNMGYS